MKIGLMSDTHGHVKRTGIAANHLLEAGAECIFHAGDIGSEQVLMELAARVEPVGIPLLAVGGNVDAGDDSIMRFPSVCGIEVAGWRASRTLDGIAFGLLHGHDARMLNAAITGGSYQVVVTGHTHRFKDAWEGGTRILNPGAVFRSSAPSVAVFDTRSQEVRRLPLLL